MSLSMHVFEGYLPLLIVIALAFLIGAIMLGLNHFLAMRPTEKSPKKYDTYECGVPYEGNAYQQFSVRYYLIGIIFLIFDVEVIFMYPWALLYKHIIAHSFFMFFEMIFSIAIFLVGYGYLRLRGAFEWD